MRAIYVMCDGSSRKIGISKRPKLRRSQIQVLLGRPVSLKHQFWITDEKMAARVEIMAHALAGNPVMGKEWFGITEGQACQFVVEAITRLGAQTVSGHKEPHQPSQRAATKRYREKMTDLGQKICTFSLSSSARTRLKEEAKAHGSQGAAAEALIHAEYEKMVAAKEAGAAYP